MEEPNSHLLVNLTFLSNAHTLQLLIFIHSKQMLKIRALFIEYQCLHIKHMLHKHQYKANARRILLLSRWSIMLSFTSSPCKTPKEGEKTKWRCVMSEVRLPLFPTNEICNAPSTWYILTSHYAWGPLTTQNSYPNTYGAAFGLHSHGPWFVCEVAQNTPPILGSLTSLLLGTPG